MCFLWYFQEYNQTSENIFRNFFWNATKHMKTFSFPEMLLHEPNGALGSVRFDWKWNSEIIFRKIRRLVGMVNSVKLKIFSVWSKIQPKTTKIIFSPYFHFKPFPPLSHIHSSLTHALPLSKLHCSDPHTEPNGTIHTDAPRSRSRWSPKLRRSTSITITIEIGEIAIAISLISREASIAIEIGKIAIAISLIEIAPIAIAISPRKYDLFWVLFEFLGMNDIMCLFGSWENVSNK